MPASRICSDRGRVRRLHEIWHSPGDVAYHDYEGTGRSLEERERFLADFGDKHIMVLRNHGLFVVGRTIPEAFVATYRMERACTMQLTFSSRAPSSTRSPTRWSAQAMPSLVPAPHAATIRTNSTGRRCCVNSTASTQPTRNRRPGVDGKGRYHVEKLGNHSFGELSF